MKRLFVVLALASLAGFAQEKQAPESKKIDPTRNKALENALKNLSASPLGLLQMDAKKAQADGPCLFIAVAPVNRNIDKRILKKLPSGPPIDNMPVLQPPPTCGFGGK
jgi:hypothetical protein